MNPDMILEQYRDRSAFYSTLHAKQQMIADIYNGRAKVPLPDMDRDEMPSIPNLLAQGVDQMAGRITSVIPSVQFSSKEPGTRKWDRVANAASRTVTGWWQADRLKVKHQQRGRRIIAYGMAPVVIGWNHEEHRPTWRVRHPIETLPSLDLEPGVVRPRDCIFTYTRTVGWMKAHGYAEHLSRLIKRSEHVTNDTRITIIEYVGPEWTVLMAAGYFSQPGWADLSPSGALSGVVLTQYRNLTDGLTPVVIPSRLTLDTMTGQFDNMMGMFYQQARLMALETIAVEKGIFPDTYLIGRPNETPKFVEGPHDGRTGLVSIVTGGDVKEIQSQPGYMTQQTIDRLERAQRVTAGIPAEFGGESGTNIRTGRRGDAVLAAVIDFPVGEAQDVFAAALEEENKTAIALAKNIDGGTKRTIYVGTGNARRPVTYIPNETFTVTEHTVSYPVSGTDLNTLIIGLGQRLGLGTMSKETAQHLDPFIDNPEAEHDAIIAEGLEAALVGSIQQQAAQGAIPPLTLAKVMRLVKNDKMELAEAMERVTQDALKEQQRQAEEQQMSMMPGEAMTPDAAAADPTVAAMAGGVPNPDQTMSGMKNLGDMLGRLRRPAMTITPFRGTTQGAM